MKHLLTLIILILTSTSASYSSWLSTPEFSLENINIKLNAVDDCTFSISPTTGNFANNSGAAGPRTVNVTALAGCAWTASSNDSWIQVSPASGTGNGTVTVTVNTNSGPARTGTTTISGQTYTATQSTGCAWRFGGPYADPTSVFNYGPQGSGPFSVPVRTSNNACLQEGATISSNVPWITVSGTYVTIAPNTGAPRSGQISIFPSDGYYQPSTLTFAQSACTYTFNSTSYQTFSAAGGSGTVTVTTQNGCPVTATSSVPWISITSVNGATISYTVAANAGNIRLGYILVYEAGYGIAQNPTCENSHFLSPENQSVSAATGTGSFSISAGTGCSRTAVSNAPWIIITSGVSGTGPGTITYSYAANTGPARTGTITAGGKRFTLNQASGCTYSLSLSDIYIEPSGGNAGVNVTTGQGCVWNAQSNDSWITVNNATGTETGTVNFTVAPNTGASRVGTITIGGKTLAVSQSAAVSCPITVPSETLAFAAAGGAGTFAVSAPDGCTWSATSTASWIIITNGGSSVSFTVRVNTGAARTGTINVGGQTVTISQAAGEIKRAFFDFDGDGKSDFSIYRPSLGEWWYLRSSDGGNRAFQFGTSTDKMVPADYTGDGISDFAFYRPSSGQWFILRSNDFSYYAFPFGIAEDIPVPADYDGDGKTDPAVFRPSTNIWYILKSTGGVIIEQMGAAGDVPVVADYDGDGRADRAVYRPSNGKWQIQRTTDSGVEYQFGTSTDKPVQADYDGDGKANPAYYRPSTNEWFILRSNGTTLVTQFGASGDIPTPADYDGDGKTDIAIYRPSTTDWWYAASASNGQQRAAQFGNSTDLPVPSAYIR